MAVIKCVFILYFSRFPTFEYFYAQNFCSAFKSYLLNIIVAIIVYNITFYLLFNMPENMLLIYV